MEEDYKTRITYTVLNRDVFLRMTIKRDNRHPEVSENKVVVRQISVKQNRCYQISSFIDNKDISKNFNHKEMPAKLDELLSIPFNYVCVQTTLNNIHITVTKKNKTIIKTSPPSRERRRYPLWHNRIKNHCISVKNEKKLSQNLVSLTLSE